MSAYEETRAGAGPCVLLESTTVRGPLARLSVLAHWPRAVLVADRRALLRETPPGRWPDEGGVAGALAYDFARPGRPKAATPLLVAVAVDRFVVEEAVGQPSCARPGAPGGIDLPAWSNLSREQHRAKVLRLKEHIAAGDIYQANLSQRFQLPFDRGGLALYHPLRRISPAPFSGYLRAGGIKIVSASPERLVLVDGDRSRRPAASIRAPSSTPLLPGASTPTS